MMAARRYCTFVLLLYLKVTLGQQALNNNQNIATNNANGLQQNNLQRANNLNQNPNGAINTNLVQQNNLQATNLQQSPNLSGSKQGNLQQSLSQPSNLQSQSAPVPQNNLQITKIGFTPVSSTTGNNPYNSGMQLPNGGGNANVQILQPQNMPNSNVPASQSTNSPITTLSLADLVTLKGQAALLSLLSPQNGQSQQNQPIVVNAIPAQNQLSDTQKQYLVRSLQPQNSGQNQQAVNLVQAQPNVVNMDNQQQFTFRGVQGTPQQGQAIVTPIGNQPAYITVQAQPLTSYLQNYQPQVQTTPEEEEPSILSIILSELGPQYGLNVANSPLKKGSKPNLKSLIPLIIGLLKERNNCGCKNCACHNNNNCQNNACQNNWPANVWPNNMMTDPQMAQIFGGYSNQITYGQEAEDASTRVKKNDDEESRNNDKERMSSEKKIVAVESEEGSEEDDSEYVDDE